MCDTGLTSGIVRILTTQNQTMQLKKWAKDG